MPPKKKPARKPVAKKKPKRVQDVTLTPLGHAIAGIDRRLSAVAEAIQRVEASIANVTAKLQGALVTKCTDCAERAAPPNPVPAPAPGLGTAQPFYEPTPPVAVVSFSDAGTGETR